MEEVYEIITYNDSESRTDRQLKAHSSNLIVLIQIESLFYVPRVNDFFFPFRITIGHNREYSR